MSQQQQMTPRQVQHKVAAYYNVDWEDLRVRKNAQHAKARFVAMYLCRHMLGLSFPEIGRSFERDHTSVMHAVRKTEQSPRLLKDAQELRDDIEGRLNEFCEHCGQNKNRRQAVEDIKIEQARLSRRLAALESDGLGPA